MRTSKFTETQIIATLKQADAGVPVKDICRQIGISTATYYQWKKQDGVRSFIITFAKQDGVSKARRGQVFHYHILSCHTRPYGAPPQT